jgi:hypothetical protein
LAACSTAVDANKDVNLFSVANVIEGLQNEPAFGVVDEVLFEFSVIHRDFASTWLDANSGNRALASTCSEAVTADFVFFAC